VTYGLKQKLGAALIDWPRFELNLQDSWQRIRNRHEQLGLSPDGRGVECRWQWTSDLHVAKVFPSLGTRLMNRCLSEWPIESAPSPPQTTAEPQLSFIIGHRGRERLGQLMATLATIAAQRGAACECVVVEQSMRSEARDRLPAWVRYIHTPLPVDDLPYCRAWALNVGARAATGKLLVFHDNDMLAPSAYAAELVARHAQGYEAINLKRFVFYMSQRHSEQIQSGGRIASKDAPEAVVQNLEAGGSIAMDRQAFLEIGGYDEAFVGWGGEDNEFWQRALLRRAWRYAYLPLVHLWHSAQPLKTDAANPNARRFAALTAVPPEQRVIDLTRRDFGNARGLSVHWRRAMHGANAGAA
jgi:hypothetical protein